MLGGKRGGAAEPTDRFVRMGLRGFLFVVLSASAAIPTAVLGFGESTRWAQREAESADLQTRAAARSAAAQLSLAMRNYVHAAESFSARVGQGDTFEPTHMGAALLAQADNQPELIGAYIADSTGTSLLHVNRGRGLAPGGVHYADRDYVQQILGTHHSAISRVDVGRTTRVLAVQVAAPIFHGEELVGLTCSSIDLNWLMRRVTEAAGGIGGGRILVLDGEGRRIIDSEGPEQQDPANISDVLLYAGMDGTGHHAQLGLDENDRLVRAVAFQVASPTTGWRVIAMKPQAAVDREAHRVRLQTFWFALTAIVISLGLSAWMANWLARPVRALAKGAASIASGKVVALTNPSWRAPRELAQLTGAVQAMVKSLKAHAEELELQVLERTRELSEKNAELSAALEVIGSNERAIRDDVERARLFQCKMLSPVPSTTRLEVSTVYQPLEQVSGDIYDVEELEPGRIRVFIADATGHGVQASMRTILLKSIYDRVKRGEQSPKRILELLNERLVDDFAEGELHCAACVVDIQRTANGARVVFANGGGPPLYVLSPATECREVYTSGPLLGVVRIPWPEPLTFDIAEEELVLISSDGLVEQTNAKRQRFESRMLELQLGREETSQATLTRIMLELNAFTEACPMEDDITLIAIRSLQGGKQAS